MDTSLSPDAEARAAGPGWRRVAARTAGICGAAMAAQLPAVLLIGWPMAPADFARICGNFVVDYGCVALVVALTLDAVARAADLPGRWPGRWRHALLVGGLAAAVATQLKPGTSQEFSNPGLIKRVQATGLNTGQEALRLSQLWFSVILVGVSAIYLMQRQGSLEAEQRRERLEAQWRQARRGVRILRDAANAARLDPQVLFGCLGLARSEYLRDPPSAGRLLDGLIDFLRGTLSGTRTGTRMGTRPGTHMLGHEIELAVLFAALLARDGDAKVVDSVAPALRRLEVCPGLLLPLVQQWLLALRTGPSAKGPLAVAAALEGAGQHLLCIHLSGPAVALDAALADFRSRLTELFGSPAGLRSQVGVGAHPQLDIRFELPLEAAHVA